MMIADGGYPMVKTSQGRVVVLGRGGEWDDIEDPEVLARIAVRDVEFEEFRDAVEALGGVVPDFV